MKRNVIELDVLTAAVIAVVWLLFEKFLFQE